MVAEVRELCCQALVAAAQDDKDFDLAAVIGDADPEGIRALQVVVAND